MDGKLSDSVEAYTAGVAEPGEELIEWAHAVLEAFRYRLVAAGAIVPFLMVGYLFWGSGEPMRVWLGFVPNVALLWWLLVLGVYFVHPDPKLRLARRILRRSILPPEHAPLPSRREEAMRLLGRSIVDRGGLDQDGARVVQGLVRRVVLIERELEAARVAGLDEAPVNALRADSKRTRERLGRLLSLVSGAAASVTKAGLDGALDLELDLDARRAVDRMLEGDR